MSPRGIKIKCSHTDSREIGTEGTEGRGEQLTVGAFSETLCTPALAASGRVGTTAWLAPYPKLPLAYPKILLRLLPLVLLLALVSLFLVGALSQRDLLCRLTRSRRLTTSPLLFLPLFLLLLLLLLCSSSPLFLSFSLSHFSKASQPASQLVSSQSVSQQTNLRLTTYCLRLSSPLSFSLLLCLSPFSLVLPIDGQRLPCPLLLDLSSSAASAWARSPSAPGRL